MKNFLLIASVGFVVWAAATKKLNGWVDLARQKEDA